MKGMLRRVVRLGGRLDTCSVCWVCFNEFYQQWLSLFEQSALPVKEVPRIAPKWKNAFDKSKN